MIVVRLIDRGAEKQALREMLDSVRGGRISLAVDNGAGTVAQVCAATGAGRTCGSCVFTVKRLLTQRVELTRPRRAS